MKIKAYKRRGYDGVVLVGDKLPHGIRLEDPCYPCIWLTGQWDIANDDFILSESDEFFVNGYKAPNYYVGLAYESLGGKKKVEEMMRSRIRKWEEMTKG